MTASVWRLPRGDEGYPAPLQDLDEPPAALHGIGDAGLVSGIGRNTAVTIVGSRHPSSYGLEVAEELGYLLAGAGLVVVSGMALGIDAAAHRGALDAAGPTIAVLGSGPDVVYPRSERRLYERITSVGAVVSEMPPGTVPGPGCFPKRNRIMAALGTMTVVVEAAQPSGSLITAEQAAKLGREVGAVPGRVTSRVARGTNALLAEGAGVIRDAQDVLDEWSASEPGRCIATGRRSTRSWFSSHAVADGASTPGAAAVAVGVAAADAAVGLARLELLGYLRADPAGRYERTSMRAPEATTLKP